MKIKQSESAKNSAVKTSNQSRNNRLILLIFSLLVSILVGYFIWRKIQINAAQQSVDDCSLNNNCARITSALETLVLAQKNLKSFNLDHTNLEEVNLSNADLYRINLSYSNLEEANISQANLYRAHLDHANLKSANLERANLSSAILIDTKNLTPTQIKSACNWSKAFYQGRFDSDYAEWIIERQANQEFIHQLQEDKDSDPKQPIDCSKWKRWTQER